MLWRGAQMYREQFLYAKTRDCALCKRSKSGMCASCRFSTPTQKDIDDLFIVAAGASMYLKQRRDGKQSPAD